MPDTCPKCRQPLMLAEWAKKHEAFFKTSFPFREGPAGRQGLWVRYLCPKCNATFAMDAERRAFLETTLPPHLKVGDELQVPAPGSKEPDEGSGTVPGSR